MKIVSNASVLIGLSSIGKLQSLKKELNDLRHHGRFRIGQAIYEGNRSVEGLAPAV